MGTWTGFARDFTDSSITGLEIYVHPQDGPSIRNVTWDRIFVDKPFSVEWVSSGGSFEVDLEPHQTYLVEFFWSDTDRSRVGRSVWSHPFRAPAGDGTLASIIGLPARNGMVRVRDRDPNSSDAFQYVYNEVSGDLFERTG